MYLSRLFSHVPILNFEHSLGKKETRNKKLTLVLKELTPAFRNASWVGVRAWLDLRDACREHAGGNAMSVLGTLPGVT